jgi:hypothetical protein
MAAASHVTRSRQFVLCFGLATSVRDLDPLQAQSNDAAPRPRAGSCGCLSLLLYSRPIPHPRCVAVQLSSTRASTSSGMAPFFRMVSWKALRSKRSPSAVRAFWRSSSRSTLPTM